MPYFEQMPQAAVNWLQGPNGAKFLRTLGLSIDQMVELWRTAVRHRFPWFASMDALEAVGSERGIIRGPVETEISYRARVFDAWVSWELAGSPKDLLLHLKLLGYPNTAIVQQNGLSYTIDGSNDLITVALGANPLRGGIPWWTFDGDEALWNRFAVLFYPPFPVGWTNIQNPPTGATAPTLQEVDFIRKIVNARKPAKALLVTFAVLLDGRCIGWPVRIIGNGTNIADGPNAGAIVYWTP